MIVEYGDARGPGVEGEEKSADDEAQGEEEARQKKSHGIQPSLWKFLKII